MSAPRLDVIARSRAMAALAKLHPDEYEALLRTERLALGLSATPTPPGPAGPLDDAAFRSSWAAGESLEELAGRYGVSTVTIWRWARSRGLERRARRVPA